MKKALALLLICLMALSMAACGSGAAANKNLLLLTGEQGSAFYAYGGSLADALSAALKDINVTAATGVPEDNAQAVNKKAADLALVQGGVLADAYNGAGSFEAGGRLDNLAAIGMLYSDDAQADIILACRRDLDTEAIHTFTKALFENKDKIAHEKTAVLDPASAAKNAPIPLHPGAEQYYNEVGALQ